jgi:hypothetical protein
MASTMASSLQQLSTSFGLASGTLLAGWFLGHVSQRDASAVVPALHHAFVTLGVLTMLSSLSFWKLRRADGENVSRGRQEAKGATDVEASVQAQINPQGGSEGAVG